MDKCEMCGIQVPEAENHVEPVLCESCLNEVLDCEKRLAECGESFWAPCCVCGKNQVDVGHGFDTCDECLKKA